MAQSAPSLLDTLPDPCCDALTALCAEETLHDEYPWITFDMLMGLPPREED